MAPFLVRHPLLLNNWVIAREEALARVRAQKTAGTSELSGFKAALQTARENAEHWRSAHPVQMARLEDLRSGLNQIRQFVTGGWNCESPHSWDTLWRWGADTLPLEAQEALLALLLEPHGALVDDLAGCMCADESEAFAIDGAMTVGELGDVLARNYDWAFGRDYGRPQECARFWYVSEDKLEPRLGERHGEPGAERELPLDIGRRAAALSAALHDRPADEPVARLLLEMPDHRPMVRRAQMSVGRPFAEIRDNLISADLLPIDMLRCKLAFFGATRFDPRSDRWVRISLFQGAPYPDEMSGEADL